MTMAEGDLAVTELHFVRDHPIPPKSPPAAMTGAFGWVRANLLSTPFNIGLTVVIVLLLAWAIPELIKFLLVDAVWSGTDRDACREIVQHRAHMVGAVHQQRRDHLCGVRASHGCLDNVERGVHAAGDRKRRTNVSRQNRDPMKAQPKLRRI